MLHGGAPLGGRRKELEPLIAELHELAAGRDDIRVECGGATPGAFNLLKQWLRTGYERSQDMWVGYTTRRPD